MNVTVIVDFCKLAIDFLQNGPNTKLYVNASKKLNVEVEIVQNCIYGLVNLLLLSCKHKVCKIIHELWINCKIIKISVKRGRFSRFRNNVGVFTRPTIDLKQILRI